MTDRITANYWIETAFPLAQAAATMAGEQSTGTFLRTPGETDELRERYAARVESIEEGVPASEPSLPGSGTPPNWDGIRRTAVVTLSWPLHNIGPSLPNLLATVAGNLSELKAFSGLKLLDLTLPPAVPHRVSRSAIRRRGHSQIHRRLQPSSDRHDHQALHRHVA